MFRWWRMSCWYTAVCISDWRRESISCWDCFSSTSSRERCISALERF